MACDGDADDRLTPEQGPGSSSAACATSSIGGIEVINVCLRKSYVRCHELVSLDQLLNCINTSVAAASRHAFLIFDEGQEEMVVRLCHRLRGRNLAPS